MIWDIRILKDGQPIGEYRLKWKTESDGRLLDVREELDAELRGMNISLRTSVRCAVKPSYQPMGVWFQSDVNGEKVMEVTATFSREKIRMRLVTLRDKQGKAFDPPKETEEEGTPPDVKMLILSPSLPILATRLLEKPGELVELGLMEIPDNAFRAFKGVSPRSRLLREQADTDGNFRIHSYAGMAAIAISPPADTKPSYSFEYDKDGRLLKASRPGGEMCVLAPKDTEGQATLPAPD